MCIAVAAALLAVPVDAAGRSKTQRLGGLGDGAGGLTLMAAPDGRFAALWVTRHDVRFSWASRSGVFTAPRVVPGSTTSLLPNVNHPVLATAGGGRAALAWRSNSKVLVALVRGDRISKARPAGASDTLAGIVLSPHDRTAVAFGYNGSAYLGVSSPSGRFHSPELVAAKGTSEGIYVRGRRPVVVYVAGTSLLERTRLAPGLFSAPRLIANIGTGAHFSLSTAPDGSEVGLWDDGTHLQSAARDPGGRMRITVLGADSTGARGNGAVSIAMGGHGTVGWSDGSGFFAAGRRAPGNAFGDFTVVPSFASGDPGSMVAATGPQGWGALVWAVVVPSDPYTPAGAGAVLVSPSGKLGDVTALERGNWPLGAAVSGRVAVIAWIPRHGGILVARTRLPRR
ncbi:MAG: hypothetical protein ACJ77M_15055 [Thermoleophilaceae bacterium]